MKQGNAYKKSVDCKIKAKLWRISLLLRKLIDLGFGIFCVEHVNRFVGNKAIRLLAVNHTTKKTILYQTYLLYTELRIRYHCITGLKVDVPSICYHLKLLIQVWYYRNVCGEISTLKDLHQRLLQNRIHFPYWNDEMLIRLYGVAVPLLSKYSLGYLHICLDS